MVDRLFSEPHLAQLYDHLSPPERRDDFAFYLPMIMSAQSVLDVGCGTGALLHQAREAGHTGRLMGLDPAGGMLDVARKRSDIEWIRGDLSAIDRDQEFDLIVMSGHAFQVFVQDDELRVALAAIRSALTDDGRFAFETRNPLARAWERWTPEHGVDFMDAAGTSVRFVAQVEIPVETDIVRFTTTYSSHAWDRPQVSHSTLRFLDAGALSSFLAEAGLTIEERFGDWDRRPLTEASPEIITIARRDRSSRSSHP